MSISTIKVIKERILSAPVNSKIAVFKNAKKDGKLIINEDGSRALDAVFDNTISTQERINRGCKDYVGSYYRGSDIVAAVSDMRKAI